MKIFSLNSICIITFVLITLFISNNSYAGNAKEDSLITLINNQNDLRKKVDLLNSLSAHYHSDDFRKAINTANSALSISQKIKYDYGIAKSYYNIAYSYIDLDKLDSTNYFFKLSESVAKKINSIDILSGILREQAFIDDMQGRSEEAFKKYRQALKYKLQLKDTFETSNIYSNLGALYFGKGLTDSAILYHNKALFLRNKIKDAKGESTSLMWIGYIKKSIGDYDTAIKYYSKALSISEKAGIKNNIGIALNNIAIIYQEQDLYDEAVNLFKKGISIYEKMEYKTGQAVLYGSLGVMYGKIGKNDSSYFYNYKAYLINNESGNKTYLAKNCVNLGLYYFKNNDFKNAEQFLLKALDYSSDSKSDFSQANSAMAKLMFAQKKYDKAQMYAQVAINTANEVKLIETQQDAFKINYELDKSLGNSSAALYHYENYILFRDSIKNDKNQKTAIKQQTKYEYEKLQAVKEAEHKMNLEIAEEREQKQKIISIFIAIALVLVGGFLILVFNQLKVTKAQKIIIEIKKKEADEQKHIVDEKNKEILDSINYAKRIQTAILPPKRLIKEYLPNSFVLYKPKDIVAGDFYWLDFKTDLVLFAVADCTGHGVPGAMVSVICNNGLNRSVKEFGLLESGKILDAARDIVIKEFEKSDEEVKDGMDISLCVLNTTTNKLQWSGANIPLWIVRSCHSERSEESNTRDASFVSMTNYELIEYKADKQPIGKYAEPKPFTSNEIQLQKGDTIYMFTDGYADQFGGEKGKKYKSAKMKETILSIQNEEMDKQSEMIDTSFELWKGELEQVDDVCVIGVRV
ncbi:MAG: tetratricopeptide repeat protein [Bacteroidota bacterium]